MRVDQVIPTLAWPDAIGSHALALRDTLRQAGYDSEIYYGDRPTPELAGCGRPVDELGRSDRGRWLVYQSSIGSPVFDLFAARSERKIVNYHNITPATLLEDWEPDVAYELNLGRAQLPRLAPRCELAVAVSQYNESELKAAGYPHTSVVPLLIDMSDNTQEPDPDLLTRLQEERADGGADLLFVGKVSPHKAPHDLVKMLAVLHRLYDRRARLHLVGSPLGTRYLDAIVDFVDRLKLDPWVEITGSVTTGELEAFYRCADVFVCASEHEGFCAPIIEAMARGIPVVAYGAGAVPETVANAGLVLDTKAPLRFAAAVDKVLDDAEVRGDLTENGRLRASQFRVERSKARMLDILRSLTEGAHGGRRGGLTART